MELLKKGSLLNNDKQKKLDYEKNGSKYHIDIYELQKSNSKKEYVRINNFKLIMDEKTLINYLYTELYTNNKPIN
jgi:hypothetical protein